jgi:hypothetical protein
MTASLPHGSNHQYMHTKRKKKTLHQTYPRTARRSSNALLEKSRKTFVRNKRLLTNCSDVLHNHRRRTALPTTQENMQDLNDHTISKKQKQTGLRPRGRGLAVLNRKCQHDYFPDTTVKEKKKEKEKELSNYDSPNGIVPSVLSKLSKSKLSRTSEVSRPVAKSKLKSVAIWKKFHVN